MAETIAALMIVIATIYLLRFLALRSGFAPQHRAERTLCVKETAALSSRQRVCIVEADGQRFLLGVSDSAGIRLIDRLPQGPKAKDASKVVEVPKAATGRRWLRVGMSLVGVVSLFLVDATVAHAAEEAASLTLGLEGFTGPEEISSALEMVALLTIVSIAPSILLMATCFTRVVIVLAFLRQAIGIQQLPPSQVLVGLAFFVTLFVMAPVGEQIRVDAYAPYVAKEIDVETATKRAAEPIREFLYRHTREADLELFLELSGQGALVALADVPATSLLPAYMLSELRTAFEIGFMIYLPFLVIDLIIASMLISMGMIVLPPVVISLPFKLMLFVLMDGWNRVVGSLIDGLM